MDGRRGVLESSTVNECSIAAILSVSKEELIHTFAFAMWGLPVELIKRVPVVISIMAYFFGMLSLSISDRYVRVSRSSPARIFKR